MLAWVAAMAVAASAQSALRAGAQSGQRTFTVAFTAPELDGAPDVSSAEAHVAVRLPSAYGTCRTGKRTCWLLLYLGGFDSSAEQSLRVVAPQLDALEASGATAPIVAVIVDGRTARGGGWYVDSPASGRWQTLLLSSLLPAARAALLDAPPSRTLVVGHSMGGFGALHLAEAHPEAFAGAGALNPILRPEELAELCLGHGVDVHAERAPLAGSGFCTRIVATLLDALTTERNLVQSDARAWQLSAKARASLEDSDLTRSAKLASVPRLFASTGEHDVLSPPHDIETLGSASLHPAVITTRISPGDHTSHLPEDFADAVRFLTATSPAPAASGPR